MSVKNLTHEKTLEWLISQLPPNTTYTKESLISKFEEISGNYLWRIIPDIFVNEKEIIEVETTQIKKGHYKDIPFHKIVYVVIDKEDLEPFDETIIAIWDGIKLKLLTNIKEEERVESLKVNKTILEEQIKKLKDYLNKYEPKTLENLRKEELRLKLSIEELTKQRVVIDGILMMASTKVKPLECKKCPFFASWIEETYKNEYGKPSETLKPTERDLEPELYEEEEPA